MNFNQLKSAFPDLDFDSLTLSRIPRIRILFPRKNFKGMQKSLDFVLRKIFIREWPLFTYNQLYSRNGKIYKPYLSELENLWLGDVYGCENLFLEKVDEITIHNRIIPISYDALYKISITDAWWRTKQYGEKNGLSHIEMDNFLFSEKLNFLVHVNFILLDPIDLDGVDVSSYDKKYLLNLASYFTENGFRVLIDKIDEFNV